jgi:hypothetical protein
VLLGAIVIGLLGLVELLGRSGRSGASLGHFSLALSIAGIALLQGGLVEIVRGLHADGDDEPAAVRETLASQRVIRVLIVDDEPLFSARARRGARRG